MLIRCRCGDLLAVYASGGVQDLTVECPNCGSGIQVTYDPDASFGLTHREIDPAGDPEPSSYLERWYEEQTPSIYGDGQWDLHPASVGAVVEHTAVSSPVCTQSTLYSSRFALTRVLGVRGGDPGRNRPGSVCPWTTARGGRIKSPQYTFRQSSHQDPI